MNLAITPQPKIGESIQGYSLRVAEANFAPSVSWITSIPAVQQRVLGSIGVELFGRLPKWLGDDSAIQKRAWAGGIHLTMAEATRYCPECLRAEGYWRAHWEHTLYTACHVHHRRMSDQCGVCGESLTWSRASLERCLCGASFADSCDAGPAVSPQEIELTRLLFEKLNLWSSPSQPTKSTLFEAVRALSIDDLATATTILGGYASPLKKSIKQFKLTSAAEASLVSSAAATLFADWPSRFHEFLHLLSGFGGIADPGAMPNDKFLLFTKAVTKSLSTEGLKFVIQAQREYMRKNWYRVLDKRNSWATSGDVESTDYVASRNAARMLGISWSQLRMLISSGHVKAVAKRSEASRKIWHVEKASLENARAYFGDRLTTAGVALFMGITELRVEELVQAGLISSAVDSARTYREYSKADVQILMDELRSHAVGRSHEKKS